MANFVASVGIEFNKLYNPQMCTEAEMRAFKEEMRVFKEEIVRDRREMNHKWGDLSNKLGTMVEDLVAPSIGRIVCETLDQDVLDLSLRRKRKLADGRVKEFDAIVVTPELVCLNSTKATLRSADADAFVDEIDRFREFFPELGELPVMGVLATLAVDESVLKYAEKLGFLVLAIGDEVMEVKNRPGFEAKRWR